MGKLPSNELQKLLVCIKQDSRVIVPPMIGYDAGVHQLGEQCIAVASDPCTGVPEAWFGWLLINYSASDVSLFGAKPEFCTINLLGPKGTKPELFQNIMRQTCKAAEELGIAIVRGHTGIYDSINEITGVATVYGSVKKEKLITPAGAKPGDLILCTKSLGHEIVTNFALAHKNAAQKIFGKERQLQLSNDMPLQSCVKEALALAQIEGVHAMHDATEGGFIAALNELADASNAGFKVYWSNIPISDEVLFLKAHFGLSANQMLAMSSTGTIIAAVKPEAKPNVTEALEKLGLRTFWIGQLMEKERILSKGKKTLTFPSKVDDPYKTILSVDS